MAMYSRKSGFHDGLKEALAWYVMYRCIHNALFMFVSLQR